MFDRLTALFAFALVLPFLIVLALLARFKRWTVPVKAGERPRLVWGGVAIGSLHTASNAMKSAGYDSISIASVSYKNIDHSKFDQVVGPMRRLPFGFNTIVRTLDASRIFAGLMLQRDILHGFFNGGVLGKTPLVDWEYALWKLSGGKLILLPYGSDSFIYSKLPNEPWADAVKTTYPRTQDEDNRIAQRISGFTDKADCVVGCIVHDCCLPRVDVRTVLWYPFDDLLQPEYPDTHAPFRIAHSSNHRLIKGTDALINAVAQLKEEGFDLDLDILENAAHEEVIASYRRAHIVVDQLLFGYAFSALEGLSLGKPVITGVTREAMYQPYLSLEQLKKSPMIFSSTQSIKDDLERLLSAPAMLPTIGEKSRTYAERYHGAVACSTFFSSVYNSFSV